MQGPAEAPAEINGLRAAASREALLPSSLQSPCLPMKHLQDSVATSDTAHTQLQWLFVAGSFPLKAKFSCAWITDKFQRVFVVYINELDKGTETKILSLQIKQRK